MNSLRCVEIIKNKFSENTPEINIPLLRGGRKFKASMTTDGVMVDNLGSLPLRPWCVFQEAIGTLIRNGGRAKRGNAIDAKLGDSKLSLDSVEGHIAHVVYGKKIGNTVFRRITPVACVLIWSGICKAEPGNLVLNKVLESNPC